MFISPSRTLCNKRARPVQQRLFISPAFTRRKRARPIIHQSSDRAELLKLSTDRERGVRDRLHQKDVHARKGGIQSSGDKRMHARRWMDGWMRWWCGLLAATAASRRQHQQGGMHYCASSEASSEIALGAGRRTKATQAACHALDAVPCRSSSTLCRQAGGARQLLPDRWREWRAGPDHEQSTAHYP
jgi:hypothetical protein